MKTERINVRKLAPSACHEMRRIAVRLFPTGPIGGVRRAGSGAAPSDRVDYGVGKSIRGQGRAVGMRATGVGRRLAPAQEARLRGALWTDAGSKEASLCLVECPSGQGADSGLLSDRSPGSYGSPVCHALGLCHAKTLEAGLRTALDRAELAPVGVSSDRTRAKAEGAGICG